MTDRFAPRTLCALAVVILVVGCSGPTVTAAPATPATTAGAATPAPVPSLTPEIAEAIAFRQQFGLRSDVAWVVAVAANPSAVMDFGVPLLPFERDDLESRATGDDAVVEVVRSYLDAHPDISGGLYIDQARGGLVTALVTGDVATHEAALRASVGSGALVAVRQVRWTEAELSALQGRLADAQAFLAGIPARMTTSSVDVIDNVVELGISSAVPDAAARIAAHVGAQPGQLVVTSDGTGVLLQPTGRIDGRILAPAGTDLSSLSPQYEADVDIGPRDAVGIAVAPNGTFTIDDLPPTTYTVTILQLGDTGNTVVGSARVAVPSGGVARVEIPVEIP